MGTAAGMATAAGMTVLLCLVLCRRPLATEEEAASDGKRGGGGEGREEREAWERRRRRRREFGRWPAQAPGNWRESVAALARSMAYIHSQTFGKWPFGDIAIGLHYLRFREDNLQASSMYAGSYCVQLKGREILVEMTHLSKLLSYCFLFAKRPFSVFLDSAGYSQEDVLFRAPKTGILRPDFTILRDRRNECLILLIRGAQSFKDRMAAATGAAVPFHHLIVQDGDVENLVLGYAHVGMVLAARWVAKCTIPCLVKAVNQYPDYKIKLVGHSYGGGTAALLSYILREHEEFSSTTCVAFAPAACMTWDLAESGKHFITTVINGSDLVPSCSTVSIDALRSEVRSSSWRKDLRGDLIQRTRFVNPISRFVSTLGSRMPSRSGTRTRATSAGTLPQSTSQNTEVPTRGAKSLAWSFSSLASWSCMGGRRRSAGTLKIHNKEDDPASASTSRSCPSPTVVEPVSPRKMLDEPLVSHHGVTNDEREHLLVAGFSAAALPEEITQGDLGLGLERKLNGLDEDAQAQEEAAAGAKEAPENEQPVSPDGHETVQLYPPGRIMHMVKLPPPDDSNPGDEDDAGIARVGIYETPRDLYGKIRLSRTMIDDHYLPRYRKMIELVINKLRQEESDCTMLL